MKKDIRISADVLVVGGGAAALFAAIKAKGAGADVVLVDKGGAGYSGQSPYADGFMTMTDPENDLEPAIQSNIFRGEYLANKDFVHQAYTQCEQRVQEMVEMNVKFFRNPDGSFLSSGPNPKKKGGYNLQGLEMPATLRKHAIKIGVRVIDRVMIAELLMKNGTVVGAVGLSTDGSDFYIISAKSTVMCTGAAGLKSNGWPSQNLTGDGGAMAYRAGASVMGMEFSDGHTGHGKYAHYLGAERDFSAAKTPPPAGSPLDAEGNPVTNIGTLSLHGAYVIHEGKGPIMSPPRKDETAAQTPEIGGVTAGMALHKAEGIRPIGIQGDTELPGLFAAGDSAATMQNGALYCPGGALSGSCTTGAVSGVRAAEYAKEMGDADITPDAGCEEALKELLYAPMDRKGGYAPKWVIDQLQGLMFPYYITYIKNGDRMEAVLTMLKFFSEHLVPMMKANDDHELRLAHEARNMVLNSQMKMTMALARKESRGMHYREDYPFRDDENFLCWIAVQKDETGAMTTKKIDIPKEWLPEGFDTMSYEEKYPIRLLNEKMP